MNIIVCHINADVVLLQYHIHACKSNFQTKLNKCIWVLERSCSISIKIAEFWTFHIHICRYNLHVNFLNPIHVHLHPVNKAWNCVHNWHPCACAMNVQRTLSTPKYGICVLFIVARIIKTRKNEQLCDQFWYHHREKNWY